MPAAPLAWLNSAGCAMRAQRHLSGPVPAMTAFPGVHGALNGLIYSTERVCHRERGTLPRLG